MSRLEEIGVSANLMKERGKQLNTYQKYLELEDTPFESVNDVFNDWNLKYKLWKGLEEWIELSASWVGQKFSSIDVESIQKLVDKYDKSSSVCAINMKENKVTAIFKEKVGVLKSTMPVVSYLRN